MKGAVNISNKDNRIKEEKPDSIDIEMIAAAESENDTKQTKDIKGVISLTPFIFIVKVSILKRFDTEIKTSVLCRFCGVIT